MALATSSLLAQDLPAAIPQAAAPYKTAIGLRATYGGPTGTGLDVSVKHFFWKESAIEAQFSLPARGTYLASVSYLWQPQLLHSSRFRPYAGLGLGIVGTNQSRLGERQPMETNLVGSYTIGIEYTFPRAPIALSLDYHRTFAGYKIDYMRGASLNTLTSIGVGFKYIIR